eukprot:gene40346-49167_t
MNADAVDGSPGMAIEGDGFFDAPFEVSYNVPSGQENDPEILRAENLFYNTPMTERYSEAVYGALKDIQAECAYDYQKFCGSSFYESPSASGGMLAADLFPTPDGMFQQIVNVPENARRLLAAIPTTDLAAKTGKDTLATLRTMLPHPHHFTLLSPHTSATENVKESRDILLKALKSPAVKSHGKKTLQVLEQHRRLSSSSSSEESSDSSSSSSEFPPFPIIFGHLRGPAPAFRPLPHPVPLALFDAPAVMPGRGMEGWGGMGRPMVPLPPPPVSASPAVPPEEPLYAYADDYRNFGRGRSIPKHRSSDSSSSSDSSDSSDSSESDSDSEDEDEGERHHRFGRPPLPPDNSFPG